MCGPRLPSTSVAHDARMRVRGPVETMNTSAKGSAYERAYRIKQNSGTNDARTRIYWQPPKARTHSTGYDSMAWTIRWDDVGDVLFRTEPTLYEFKSARTSCAYAERLANALDAVRPAFTNVVVVHRSRTTGKVFCEHR